MAEAALAMAIVAAIAAIASAVSAWKSAREARRVADLDEDRRHDELAPRLELQPHRHTIQGPEVDAHGNLKERYRSGGHILNNGPRSCSVKVLWEGEVRRGDGEQVHMSGLIDLSTTPVGVLRELDLGSFAVGEGRWFPCTGPKAGETATLAVVATDDQGRTWEQRLAMVWPGWSDRWPSTSYEKA